MSAKPKTNIPRYYNKVWFSKRDITNIIALKNLTEQYQVTYDSNEKMSIVHREEVGLPNMKFLMRRAGLHYYEPPKSCLLFLNNVSKNKDIFEGDRLRMLSKLKS